MYKIQNLSISKFFILITVLIAPFAIAGMAAGLRTNDWNNPERVYLFQLHVDGVGKVDGGKYLKSFRYQDRFLLPVGCFSDLLKLGFEVNPEEKVAEGRLRSGGRRYVLNVEKPICEMGGNTLKYPQAEVKTSGEEIYASACLLSRWLPLKLEVNPLEAVIRVYSEVLLPIQERVKRRNRWEHMSENDSPASPAQSIREQGWNDWDGPFLSFDLGGAIDDAVYRVNYRAKANMNLFGAISEFRLYGNGSSLIDGWTFETELKGQVESEERASIVMGEVISPRLPLIDKPSTVSGMQFRVKPRTKKYSYSTRTFSGELKDGWEVELCRNGSMVDFQTESINGRYELENIPLEYGRNEFQLNFFGPRGEFQKRKESIFIHRSLLPPGKQSLNLTLAPTGQSPQFNVFYRRGLSHASTVGLGIVQSLSQGNLRSYKYLNLQKSWGEIKLESRLAVDGEDKVGAEFIAEGDAFTLSYLFGNGYSGGSIGEEVERKLELGFNWKLSSSIWGILKATRSFVRGGQNRETICSKVYFSAGRFSLVEKFDLKLGGMEEPDVKNTVRSSLRLGNRSRFRLTNEINLKICPENILDSYELSLDGPLDGGWEFNSSVRKSFAADSFSTGISLNRSLAGSYDLGLNLSFSGDGSFNLGISFSAGLAIDYLKGQYEFGNSSLSDGGAISIQTYLDRNGNAEKDLGEEGIEGVGFTLNGVPVDARTDESGVAFIPGLDPYCRVEVKLDRSTFENIFWKSSNMALIVFPRSGDVNRISFPISVAGEVSGTVYRRQNERKKGVSGVRLQLLGNGNHLLDQSVSEYDGYFVFADVPPGDYKLRVSPVQERKEGFRYCPRFVDLEIPVTGAYVDGLEFIFFHL